MDNELLIAILGNCVTLVVTIITVFGSNKKASNKIENTNKKTIETVMEENVKVINEFKQEVAVNQAVTDTKLEELTREVREHNNFAKRMPVVEQGIEHLTEKVNFFHNV